MTQPGEGGAREGRNVDPDVAVLSGEAASQAVPARRTSEAAAPFEVNTSSPEAEPRSSYYDRPVLKEPVWIWAVPAYFFAGGAAGGAAALAAVAQGVDAERFEGLIRRCRTVASTGTAVGTGLLVYDLGRPERFLNMLRVVRPTSAMNMGSWILALSASSSMAATVLGRAGGAVGRLGALAGAAAGALGLPLAGYTGVLLSDTAVPLWQSLRRSLPSLFVVSGTSSALSLLHFASLSEDEQRIVSRLGLFADIAELALSVVAERDASAVERVGAPLKEGAAAAMWQAGTALTVATVGIALLPGGGRRRRLVSGLLGVASELALKFSVFEAGKLSARDPHATFAQQRQGGSEP